MDIEDIMDEEVREIMQAPTDIDYLIENKECTACVYFAEDVYTGNHCSPCSLPDDAEDHENHFTEELWNTIIDRVTEQNEGIYPF